MTQAADWERNYTDDALLPRQYQAARDFWADVVVLRLGENVIRETFCEADYAVQYRKMAEFFASKKGAQIIVTDLFWPHEGIDRATHEAAAALGVPVISMGDLGEKPEMSARGLFWHEGVAGHPGDLGMKTIADQILAAIR